MSPPKRLRFEITIQAPVATVWETMLGAETHRQWTTPFCDAWPKALASLAAICETRGAD